MLIVVAAVRVCGTASTPGANGKQGLCGRCLCSKLLCFPSSRSSKGLFSLLRHSDDTANQRVSCFVSLTIRTKNISSSTCCVMLLNHALSLSLLFGLLKKFWTFVGLNVPRYGFRGRRFDVLWWQHLIGKVFSSCKCFCSTYWLIFFFAKYCILPEKLTKMLKKTINRALNTEWSTKSYLYKEVKFCQKSRCHMKFLLQTNTLSVVLIWTSFTKKILVLIHNEGPAKTSEEVKPPHREQPKINAQFNLYDHLYYQGVKVLSWPVNLDV